MERYSLNPIAISDDEDVSWVDPLKDVIALALDIHIGLLYEAKQLEDFSPFVTHLCLLHVLQKIITTIDSYDNQPPPSEFYTQFVESTELINKFSHWFHGEVEKGIEDPIFSHANFMEIMYREFKNQSETLH
jgi:hypothetical protein